MNYPDKNTIIRPTRLVLKHMVDAFIAPQAVSAQKNRDKYQLAFISFPFLCIFFVNLSAHNVLCRIRNRDKDLDINGPHDQYGPTVTCVKPFHRSANELSCEPTKHPPK